MKKSIFLIVGILLLNYSQAQVTGKPFPDLAGETLSDKKISIPADTKGKYTVVTLAPTRKSEDELKTWLNPCYSKFVLKNGLMDAAYDVNLLFIPMYTGISQPTTGMAKKNMKESTDKVLYPNVVCYKGEYKKYKQALQLDDRENVYVFLLDKDGNIVHSTSGEYSDEKMEGIEENIK